MKKLHLLMLLVPVLLFSGCQKDDGKETDDEKETVVINFEGLLSGTNREFTTSDGVKANDEDYYYQANFEDPLTILRLNHYYTDEGLFGGGFTYTNYTDITTSGFTNISAITGKGQSGNTYLTTNTNEFTPARITNIQPGKYQFSGAWVTNSTYVYLAIKDGNDGFGVVKGPFTADDYFILTATGYDSSGEIGKVDFPLADFRNGKSDIVNTWTWVDFTPIASARYIEFELSSTDRNDFGMNTPSYFCMDDVTLTEK
ncbi:hypothetical protein EZS27_002079 [termite gut metagenome]|uniref:DUF4465 domain-containing protein n=1 Tax=termite gut metagenome TaxID=433724 RepID=A0A5J4SWK7_9ZZZZ